ncbi:MAG: HEAT repeat domain-containing protein, partial [Planctomycetota bacterium]
ITPRSISTSLAILFLIRSTQKAIGQLDEGVTFGGRTLPTDVSTVRMRGTKLVSDEETSVENLLTMLEDKEADGVQIGLLPENLQLNDDPEQRKEQVARLSRLLSSEDWKARRIAAKLLGRSDDIRVAPDLIYALSDDDPHVPMIAEESLRLLSRKLNSGELDIKPKDSARTAAIEYWKAWYLGLQPDYIFLDE